MEAKEKRHTCIICKKKRKEKYMDKVSEELRELLKLNVNSWICNHEVIWGRSRCKRKFVQNTYRHQKMVLFHLQKYALDNNVSLEKVNTKRT